MTANLNSEVRSALEPVCGLSSTAQVGRLKALNEQLRKQLMQSADEKGRLQQVPLRVLLRVPLRVLLRVPLRVLLRVLLRVPLRVLLRVLLRVPLRVLLRVPLRVLLRVLLSVPLSVLLQELLRTSEGRKDAEAVSIVGRGVVARQL